MPSFIVKTAATKPNTGGIPVPTTVQAAPTAQPLPIAITDLLTQLADAWQTWQTAPVAAVYPDVTATDAPDPAGEAAIVKAQRRGVGDQRVECFEGVPGFGDQYSLEVVCGAEDVERVDGAGADLVCGGGELGQGGSVVGAALVVVAGGLVGGEVGVGGLRHL